MIKIFASNLLNVCVSLNVILFKECEYKLKVEANVVKLESNSTDIY